MGKMGVTAVVVGGHGYRPEVGKPRPGATCGPTNFFIRPQSLHKNFPRSQL